MGPPRPALGPLTAYRHCLLLETSFLNQSDTIYRSAEKQAAGREAATQSCLVIINHLMEKSIFEPLKALSSSDDSSRNTEKFMSV